ncbi:MAG: GNAT family N-acetyltransferase [Pseudomonadota bacterium]
MYIRHADVSDIPAMQALERDAAELFRSVAYDFCADGSVLDREAHEFALRSGAVFLAEIDNQPAGFIVLLRMDGFAHIREVSVSRKFQKRGLGRALIAKGEDWARSQNFSAITLTTFRDIPWNAPFYRSIGFCDHRPGADEPELSAILKDEGAPTEDNKPRIAMKKPL